MCAAELDKRKAEMDAFASDLFNREKSFIEKENKLKCDFVALDKAKEVQSRCEKKAREIIDRSRETQKDFDRRKSEIKQEEAKIQQRERELIERERKVTDKFNLLDHETIDARDKQEAQAKEIMFTYDFVLSERSKNEEYFRKETQKLDDKRRQLQEEEVALEQRYPRTTYPQYNYAYQQRTQFRY